MDFTREPIVETVITPKEGYKLVLRNTGSKQEEEFSVGAVEVVSFGNCHFFRSLEKPREFLLPMTQYEIVESREIRTVLKKVEIEKAIKIGGGRAMSSPKSDSSQDDYKKRDKKKPRKRRPSNEEQLSSNENSESPEDKKQELPQPRRTLLPPPTSLISEHIERYKNHLIERGALDLKDLEEGKKAAKEELDKQEKTSSASVEEEVAAPKSET